jgi:hypothetical protein
VGVYVVRKAILGGHDVGVEKVKYSKTEEKEVSEEPGFWENEKELHRWHWLPGKCAALYGCSPW